MNLVILPVLPSLSGWFRGPSLGFTQQIFLSSNFTNTTLPLCSVDLFSNRPSVSASFPPFSGVDITAFCKIDNSVLMNLYAVNQFGLLAESTSDTFDLVFLNVAGYSTLSETGNLLTSVSVITASGIDYFSSFYIKIVPNPDNMAAGDNFVSLDTYVKILNTAPWQGDGKYIGISFV